MGFGDEIAVGGKPDADLFPSKTCILSVQGPLVAPSCFCCRPLTLGDSESRRARLSGPAIARWSMGEQRSAATPQQLSNTNPSQPGASNWGLFHRQSELIKR